MKKFLIVLANIVVWLTYFKVFDSDCTAPLLITLFSIPFIFTKESEWDE